MIYHSQPTEEEKALQSLAHELELVYGWLEAAEKRLPWACGLGILIGLVIGWLVI